MAIIPRRHQTKKGWRTIGGKSYYFRSSWEANYARVLEAWKQQKALADWEFEPRVFWFEKIKRGVRSYLPDFKITWNDGKVTWVEIKGYLDPKSKTKLNRMRIYYPEVIITVVGKKEYEKIKGIYQQTLSDWE